jgi:hypothetical protein
MGVWRQHKSFRPRRRSTGTRKKTSKVTLEEAQRREREKKEQEQRERMRYG